MAKALIRLTPLVPWGLCDFAAGSNGNAPTAAELLTSTLGITQPGGGQNWYWDVGNNTSGLVYSTTAYHALRNVPPRFSATGQQYTDTSLVGLDYPTTTGVKFVQLFCPGQDYYGVGYVADVAVMTISFMTTIPKNGAFSSYDVLGFVGMQGLDFIDIQLLNYGSDLVIRWETAEAGSGQNETVIQPNVWYKCAIQYSAGGQHKGALYDDSGVLVGNVLTANAAVPAKKPGKIIFGNWNNDYAPHGYHMYFDKLAAGFTTGLDFSTFPVIP